MSNVMKFDETMVKGLIKHLQEYQRLDLQLDEDDIDDIESVKCIVDALFQFIGKTLGENKSEEEEVVFEVPGYIEFKVAYREGAGGNGNFGIGVTCLEGIKKQIKGDAELEAIANDDSDDE